mmetsp:Transcript_25766/g.55955  ORF Transcript_25766/g.55955 Transcript_25766/m.55955 type:complete len:89 (+) Transcript_25766:2360-2626(+)
MAIGFFVPYVGVFVYLFITYRNFTVFVRQISAIESGSCVSQAMVALTKRFEHYSRYTIITGLLALLAAVIYAFNWYSFSMTASFCISF